MSQFKTINCEVVDQQIAICRFSRPEVRNALNEAMIEEIRTFLGELRGLDALRALVFTGMGDSSFLAGADIRELRDRSSADALRRINSSFFREVELFPKPTIAAIRGVALGGGLEFAMACDLRVAADDAKLGQPEVKLGIMPGAGATYRLPRLVGLGRAKELIYTGRIIGGLEALAMGLVNRSVAAESVLDEAIELARTIAANGSLAVELSKTALGSAFELPTEAAMALESASQAVLFDDAEKHARMTKFLDKK